jgi:class 3 adenylate cyclase
MRTLETTVLFQPVDDEQVEDALGAAPTVSEGTNYLGRDVLSASRSLDIDGLEWALFSDVEVQEVEQPVEDFVRNLLIAIAVFIVGITFLAVRWSDRLLQPLRITSTNLRAIRGGSADDAGSAAIPESSPAEFVALASDIDKMLATLAARSADAADRTAERRELLNKLLPPQIAQRAEAGDRDVVDQVPVVTVVEILIRGLGSLMQADSRDHARSLLDRFVEETDALAKQRGLDRIRLTGDAYVAACGTSRPHLDHAARAVSFVLDVLELFLDLVDEDPSISMSAGLHTGPVTVGLTGGSRLVYDAWGSTVQRAADLAGRAGRNELLVSAEVRSLLPPDFLTVDVTGLTDADGVVRVSGRASEGETVG